jgi:lipoprotein-anchoring transpeptidase ErfK/SrfK
MVILCAPRQVVPMAVFAAASITLVGLRGSFADTPIRIPLPERAAQMFAVQVALDRASFSPGQIDAQSGTLTTRALDAFRAARGLPANSPGVDAKTIEALGEPYAQPITRYVITEADASGPFTDQIPQDIMEQAALPALGYTSLLEALSERFHISPSLLTKLNAGVALGAGSTIVVPAVEPLQIPTHQGRRLRAQDAQPRAASIEVTKETGAVVARDSAGAIVMYAPVTVGSEQDPLPVGNWKVVAVFYLPVFNYNPDLFWDADGSQAKARIAAGPNNPVGLVWIDINKDHFGFHGTPEPAAIGRTQSHGCIRLTNWDALRLAALVGEGTPVTLR